MRSAASHWLAVAAGGAVGALLRHLLAVVLPVEPVSWATPVVNLLGAFALGVLASRASGPQAVLFWRTGVLGAFTTFSAMAVDAVELGLVVGTAYLIGLTGVGIVAAVAGVRTGVRLHRGEGSTA